MVRNGAAIDKDCCVGCGALITEGKTFGVRKLIVGAPAKVVRELSDEDIDKMHRAAPGYVRRQEMYNAKLKRID